jgi:hypothetical protein
VILNNFDSSLGGNFSKRNRAEKIDGQLRMNYD